MSDPDNDFPGVQVSTFVLNDQFVFRAPTGPALKELLRSVAAEMNDSADALNDIKQAYIAKGVLTAADSKAGGGNGAAATKPAPRKAAGARAKDAPPPGASDDGFFIADDGKSYSVRECDHGPMLDLRGGKKKDGTPYGADLYCTSSDFKAKCKPVKL